MTGTDASTPGSPPTPPERPLGEELVQRVRTAWTRWVPETTERPLWHWYTQLGGRPSAPWAHTPPPAERPPIAVADWMASMGRHLWSTRPGVALPAPGDFRRPPVGGAPPAPVAVGLPGIWESWHVLVPWAGALHEDGWDVHLLAALSDMTAPVPQLARVVEEHLASEDVRGAVLFAHSKGGLVGKTVMLGAQGWRVRGMVAFATPFEGAPIVRLAPLVPVLEELDPAAEGVRRLAGEADVNARIIQVEAAWDQSVPPGPLPGARHVVMPINGHSAMMASPQAARTLVVLADQLAERPAEVPAEVPAEPPAEFPAGADAPGLRG